jgi:hypothetical protein
MREGTKKKHDMTGSEWGWKRRRGRRQGGDKPFRAHARVTKINTRGETTTTNTRGVNAVLIGNNFPELGTDLVAALAALDVNNFTHVTGERGEGFNRRA